MRGHGKTQRKKPVRNFICAAALTLGANWPTAQGAEFETLEAESAVSPAGVRVVPNWQSEPPVSAASFRGLAWLFLASVQLLTRRLARV